MSEILWALRCRATDCPINNGELCLDHECGTEAGVKMPSSVSAHEKNLRRLPCVVTGKTNGLTLHHARSASMATSPYGTPGVSQKQNPALQMRLVMDLHVGGPQAIDGGRGAITWETLNGTQTDHLNSTSRQLRYSVWMLASQWASWQVQDRLARFCKEQPSLFLRVTTESTTRK